MSPPTGPITREERRAAVAAWQALPLAVRRLVVTASRAGDPVPDPAAAELGRRYAVAMLTPRGRHWWQRHRWHAAVTPALVGVAVVLIVLAWWLRSTGVPWADLWGALLLAVCLLALAGVNRGLRRTLLALAAHPPSG